MYHYGLKTERCDNYVPGSIKVSNITDKQWTLQHVLVRTDDVAKCTKLNRQNNARGVSQSRHHLLRFSAAIFTRPRDLFIPINGLGRFFVVLTRAAHPLSRTMLSRIIYRLYSRDAIKATLITIAPLLSPFNALFPIDRNDDWMAGLKATNQTTLRHSN